MSKKSSPAKLEQVGSLWVETWWDPSSRVWITTMSRQPSWSDVRGSSDYAGNQLDAVANHEDAVLHATSLLRVGD